MARFENAILSGKIADMIIYNRLGTPCMRSMPSEVRQTKATKESALTFGKAASISKFLRKGLVPVLTNNKSREMEYRLNAVVSEWLRSQDLNSSAYLLSSFQINKETSVTDRLTFPLTINWTKPNVILNIPAFNPFKQVKARLHTRKMHWKIVITGSRVEDPDLTDSYTTSLDMDWVDTELPARQIELPYTLRADSINIVALSMEFTGTKKRKDSRVSDKRWMPVGIVEAKYCLPK